MFRTFRLEQQAYETAKAREEAKIKEEKILQNAAKTLARIDARMQARVQSIFSLVKQTQKQNRERAFILGKLAELQRTLKSKIDSPWILCEISPQNSSQFRIELSAQKNEIIRDIFAKILEKNLITNIIRSDDFETVFVYFNLSDLDDILQKTHDAKNSRHATITDRYVS